MSFTAVMSGSGALAVSEFHRCTVSSESPHRITNQRTGFVVTSPQTSHLNSCSFVMLGSGYQVPYQEQLLLRDRGWAPIGRQHRQFADLFPLDGTTQVGRMVHHPKFRNDFADQLPVTEQSHDRTLRNHNAHRLRDRTHVGGRDVTTPESQRHVYLSSDGVEIAARGEDDSIVTYDECSIQLRQFLDGS